MTRMKIAVFKLLFIVFTLAFQLERHKALASKAPSNEAAMNILSKCPQSKCLVRLPLNLSIKYGWLVPSNIFQSLIVFHFRVLIPSFFFEQKDAVACLAGAQNSGTESSGEEK